MKFYRHATGLFLVSLLLLTVAGCSRISLVYHTADFFIEGYADDYLSLNGDQKTAWRPAVDVALAHHRREELPYLAGFFDAAYRANQKHFDNANMECLLDAFEEIYRRHMGIAATLAAPLLVELTPKQIQGLARKFQEEDAEETREDRESVRHRERKRAKRFGESARWWIGPLTQSQRQIVAEVTAAMPDTALAWNTYQGANRAKLIQLLQEHKDETSIRRFLTDWLVDYQDLPPGLRQARVEMRNRIAELFVRLDASFSPEQRAHLAKRLRNLRDDFMSLQRNPQMVTTGCSA